MTLWYYMYMCFHVPTVLKELLASRVTNQRSDTILENATQPCCSIVVKNLMLTITHNTGIAGCSQVLWLLTERSKTWWLTCFSGCTGVHSTLSGLRLESIPKGGGAQQANMRSKGGGKIIFHVRKHMISRGVWGHAPPGNFCILDSLRLLLVHSQALHLGGGASIPCPPPPQMKP